MKMSLEYLYQPVVCVINYQSVTASKLIVAVSHEPTQLYDLIRLF